MTVGTLGVFFLTSKDDLSSKRSMAFTTLILFQLFNSLCARSDSDSAFHGFFRNRWLWGAILFSIGLQVILLDVPFLRRTFDVVQLSPRDWLLCVVVASSVLWLSETTKYIRRSDRFAPYSRTLERSSGSESEAGSSPGRAVPAKLR